MTDYGNIPVLKWQGAISAKKAIAQIHHAEPLILQMPEDLRITVDASACGCREGKTSGIHLNCNPDAIFTSLAETNDLPELADIAKVAHEAGQVVDYEESSRRFIIHD